MGDNKREMREDKKYYCDLWVGSGAPSELFDYVFICFTELKRDFVQFYGTPKPFFPFYGTREWLCPILRNSKTFFPILRNSRVALSNFTELQNAFFPFYGTREGLCPILRNSKTFYLFQFEALTYLIFQIYFGDNQNFRGVSSLPTFSDEKVNMLFYYGFLWGHSRISLIV
jgi:hypothetical protein